MGLSTAWGCGPGAGGAVHTTASATEQPLCPTLLHSLGLEGPGYGHKELPRLGMFQSPLQAGTSQQQWLIY